MAEELKQSPEHNSGVRQKTIEAARAIAGEQPTPQLRSLICPFCGSVTPDTGRCRSCSARFDPLSRQATQNQMGPWTIRDEQSPFRPGCTYETLLRLIDQGVVRLDSVIRGPTTRQFWTLARHTPSVAHRLGVCHNCQTQVERDAFMCPSCQASFSSERDRQHMGLGPSRVLPGHGNAQQLIATAPVPAPESERATPASPTKPTHTRATSTVRDEDAINAISEWRRAYQGERTRAWIAVGLACLVTIMAIGYGVLGFRFGPGAENARVTSSE
jgi:RNA polymerase subunit RPABC4/transcription elongation factor Spt4